LTFRADGGPVDVRDLPDDLVDEARVADDSAFVLDPGAFVLGSTLERVTLGDDIMGLLDGKSSLGRLGIHVHATASVVDAGFSGVLTLELSNVTPRPVLLYPRMRIAQLGLLNLTGPALHSKYQDANDVMLSQVDGNFVDGVSL